MINLAAFKSLTIGRFALVVITILFSFFIFHFSSSTVHAGTCDDEVASNLTAQEAMDLFNKCAIEKNVFDDKVFNTNQIAGTIDSLNMLLTGESSLHPETNVATRGTGALATTGNLVASLYSTPPASGVEYFAQKIKEINPVQPVYAQEDSIGYNALTPVKKIWAVFRNISYVGFVIVFVIMGFMIMFRAKISPQAVATVQDSIPRIVIALILVTFSYAIAGLMIDVMFLFLNIIINTLKLAGLVGENSNIVFEQSIFGVIWNAWDDVFAQTTKYVASFINNVIDLPGWLDDMFAGIGGTVAGLVIGIAVLFMMFRIFLMLLMAYVMIIVLTMAAPFFFLIQALPGNSGAKEWFKQMASNIAVFPTVALMIIFAGILAHIGEWGAIDTSPVTHQNIGQFPLLTGGINANALAGLIGLGFLLMTPSAADLVKNAFGTKGPQMGGAIGQSLAGGAGVISGAGRAGIQQAGKRGPIAARLRAGEMLRQEEAAAELGLPTYAAQGRQPKGKLATLISNEEQKKQPS